MSQALPAGASGPGEGGCSPVSVIVPAHNEESVIGRCLQSLSDGALPGELEIIVVCNGCHDGTAGAAHQAVPGALVLETPVASKAAALNLGDGQARYFPRFYVDADVELRLADLRVLASVLRKGDVHCASPVPTHLTEGCPWLVRAFYDVWLATPYHFEQRVGTGAYGLSREGRARFERFPDITADDQFVQQLFDISERRAVPEALVRVHPPRGLRGLVNTRARTYRGNRELADAGLSGTGAPSHGTKTALKMARQPAKLPAVAVYVTVNVVAKGLSRRGARWERDHSSRVVGGAPAPSPGE